MTVICHAFYYHLALRGRIQLEKSSRQDERANLTCEKSFPPRRAVEFKERFPPRRAGEFNLREVPATTSGRFFPTVTVTVTVH
jgi:hypothetical protein